MFFSKTPEQAITGQLEGINDGRPIPTAEKRFLQNEIKEEYFYFMIPGGPYFWPSLIQNLYLHKRECRRQRKVDMKVSMSDSFIFV